MPDYYQILGVAKDATQDDIKRAYRKLAAQHHPDRGGETAKFQEIQQAYDTLGDPDKRAAYDQPQFHGNDGFQFHQNNVPPGFEEIFSHFGMFGDIFGRRPQAARNKTMNFQASITLEDAFHGKDLIVNATFPNGKEQVLEVKIPPGIHHGNTLRLAGVGDDSVPNAPRGDIHVTVLIQPHPVFQRNGDDLLCEISIDCIDAMLGRSINVNTLDGKVLEVAIHSGTQPGQMLAIQGHGMPSIKDSRFRGRLLLSVKVTIPTFLTDIQKESLKTAFK